MTTDFKAYGVGLGLLKMGGQDRFLRLFLWIVGTASLLAVAAVVMPYAWMNAIHQWLGMGRLPSDPIVGYLARSTWPWA